MTKPTYYSLHKEACNKRTKEWYENNRRYVLEHVKKYQKKHKKQIKKYQHDYFQKNKKKIYKQRGY